MSNWPRVAALLGPSPTTGEMWPSPGLHRTLRLGFDLADIDECALPTGGHICSYRCINIPGSFQCSCPSSGYRLAPNGRNCQGECAGLPGSRGHAQGSAVSGAEARQPLVGGCTSLTWGHTTGGVHLGRGGEASPSPSEVCPGAPLPPAHLSSDGAEPSCPALSSPKGAGMGADRL